MLTQICLITDDYSKNVGYVEAMEIAKDFNVKLTWITGRHQGFDYVNIFTAEGEKEDIEKLKYYFNRWEKAYVGSRRDIACP